MDTQQLVPLCTNFYYANCPFSPSAIIPGIRSESQGRLHTADVDKLPLGAMRQAANLLGKGRLGIYGAFGVRHRTRACGVEGAPFQAIVASTLAYRFYIDDETY